MLYFALPPELPSIPSAPKAAQDADDINVPAISARPAGTVSLDPKQVVGPTLPRFSGAQADSSGQGNLDSFPTSQPAAVPGEVTPKANPVEPAIERSALHVSEPVNPDAAAPAAPPNRHGETHADALSFEADETSPLPTVASPAMENSEAEAAGQHANPADTHANLCEPAASGQLLVENIEVIAEHPVFSQAELNDIFSPFVGRELSCTEQQQAADALTQAYLDQGYLTTRAEPVPNSALDDGILAIQVQEGFIEAIEIVGLERLRENYIRSRIELVTSAPVSASEIENQLRLLRQNPLIENIEASLSRGQQARGSLLRVLVVEADPFNGYIGLDNYSPPPVGSTQATLALAHLNLTGRGDQLGASYQRTTTGGSSTLDIGYTLPVNPKDGTLSLAGSFEWNQIPLSPTLDIDGNAQEYSISFRQPLKRTVAEEFALSLGFDYRNGQTFIGNRPFGFGFGPDPDTGISRTSVIRFGQDYVRRDTLGAWSARSQFSLGVGLFGATSNPDPIPDSNFIHWLGQAQRVQQLNPDNLLILSVDLQLTPDTLLPSEKFVIGGGQSIRGYRQNLRGGDNGFRFTAENRITLQRDAAGLSTLQLAPFLDMGTTWNVADNPNPQPSQRFLMGLGVGIIWEPLPDLDMRLDYGIPLINTPRGNDLQDNGIYFRFGYRI